MSLRICLVTPFSWSQPHGVNEHVAGLAAALRARGHRVTVLAPSGSARDLRAGRRTLAGGGDAELIALCPAIPVSRQSRMGVSVGARANLALALAGGGFDVVHGFEPGLPSLSYLALRDAEAIAVATFFSPERLGYPPRKALRERLLGRLDALLATSPAAAEAAAERFPGRYQVIPAGIDVELFRPAEKRSVVLIEARQAEWARARALLRALDDLPGWDAVLLRTRPLSGRPTIPRRLAGRVRVRTALDAPARARELAPAAIVAPAPGGLARLPLEAGAAGAALVEAADPLAAAAELRLLATDADRRGRIAAEGRAAAERQSFAVLAAELDALYTGLAGRRRPARRGADLLAGRDWIVVDLHMHTSHSHDCSTGPAALLDHAESIGLGAIAVTDHNVFGGAREAIGLAGGRRLIVIPGEEVKTDGQGEVIGLFLSEHIPRGMCFGDTIAAIKEQGGLVYMPHPFDRLHAIPDPATLHAHLDDIDVLEVYNARLLFDSFNDEALRFAQKYNLLQGAGSDAHVLQGVGTGALRMRRFDGPEEFLISLRTAEVLRRPKSIAYLQSLKWVAQVKERVR